MQSGYMVPSYILDVWNLVKKILSVTTKCWENLLKHSNKKIEMVQNIFFSYLNKVPYIIISFVLRFYLHSRSIRDECLFFDENRLMTLTAKYEYLNLIVE